jgi:hypothetical protein
MAAYGREALSVRGLVHVLADLARGEIADVEAEQLAQQIQAALVAQMEGNLGHVLLWEQFLRTPDDMAEAAIGVVHGLAERDAVLAEWLSAAWKRWQEAQPGACGLDEVAR